MNRVSRNSLKEYQYLKKVASDVYGAIKPKTYNRYRYFVMFLDRALRYLKVKLLCRKNKVYNAFLKFKNHTKNNLKGYKICIFATDNGGEYVNKCF